MIKDNYLDIKKLGVTSEVKQLFKIIEKHGGVLRFVGGAVRDALKDIKSNDLNLATDLSPDELVEACMEEGIRTIPLGIRQGAVGVILKGKTLEVSSLHKYVTQKDGVSEMEFTDDWEEDASKRDLTINAVYADEKGNVLDYYNGVDDLEKGVVRFIGSAQKRLSEDYIRILRYFRFYSQFGNGEPNAKALTACIDNAAKLKTVPMENIRDELSKILQTSNAAKVFKLMQDKGILASLLPDAAYIDDLEFFNQVVKGLSLDDLSLVRLFVLYRPNKSLAENMAVRLKFNRHDKQLFSMLAKYHYNLADYFDSSKLLHIIYHHGQDFASASMLASMAAGRSVRDDFWMTRSQIYKVSIPKFPLKGKDLIAAGVEQKNVGKILKDLENIWIDSDFCLNQDNLLAQVSVM